MDQTGEPSHLLDVVESVLGHIGDPQVGVLPDHALLRLQLSSQNLDHGGLASTVGSNDCHTAQQRAGQADVGDDLPLSAGVAAGEK